MPLAAVAGGQSSWLSSLEAEPWYQSVAQQFQTNAPDVPIELWEAEILNEDSKLDVKAQDYLSSGHYGLFQENANFPTTVGLAPATTTQLQDPVYNAYVASLAMEKAIKTSKAGTWVGAIEALETAGWPGSISSQETQNRFNDVSNVIQMEGGTSIQPTSPLTTQANTSATAGDPCAGVGILDLPGCRMQQLVSGVQQGLASDVQQATTALLIGGVLIAAITGGFMLLGSAIGVKPPVPVPVPV